MGFADRRGRKCGSEAFSVVVGGLRVVLGCLGLLLVSGGLVLDGDVSGMFSGLLVVDSGLSYQNKLGGLIPWAGSLFPWARVEVQAAQTVQYSTGGRQHCRMKTRRGRDIR